MNNWVEIALDAKVVERLSYIDVVPDGDDLNNWQINT